MNTELKFKYVVKRQNGHVFSEIFTMKQIENGEALKFLNLNHAREMDVFKYQYIGKLDIKGKEIYEGNLVQYREGIEHWNGKYTTPLEVKMINGSYYPFCGCGGEYSMEYGEAEIVGNVYDK